MSIETPSHINTVLWHIEISHYNEKARWALDYKRVPYELRTYPEDAAERERALALEDYFDEELGPRPRRFFWHHTLGDTDATVDAVLGDAGVVRRGLMRATASIARPLVRRDYDVDEASAAEALQGMRAAMDRLEREIGPGGYLVGESFSVADLAAAAMFTPVLAPPQRPYAPAQMAPALMEVREELSARKGGVFVAEMYARHRGRSAAVPRG